MQTVYQLALSTIMFTVLLTGGVLSPRVAAAATYYVATTGSDANSGSASRPFQTIDRGVSVLQAGDTLYIRGGTYTNQAIGYPSAVPVPSGTSWSNATTIAGYPGETIILDGYDAGLNLINAESYLIFDNLIIDGSGGGGIFINCDVHHIRFQNGEVKGSPGSIIQGCGSYFEVLNSKIHGGLVYGFYWGGHDSVFDGNEVYDNGGFAYHIFSSGANTVSNNIIRNNRIHGNGLNAGNGSGGVILASGSNNQAYDNLVYENFSGIQVDYGCTNCQVYNNAIYYNIYYSILIGAGALNTIVKDNILYWNGIEVQNYGAGTILITNITTDP